MRTILLVLALIFVFGSVSQAQTAKQFTLRVNQQKVVTPEKLTVKFVSLIEDARCAEDTQCIWAGNAKIKVTVRQRNGELKTIEMNTNTGPQGDTYGHYAIRLVKLTPVPRSNIRINRNAYTATFSVSRLTR